MHRDQEGNVIGFEVKDERRTVLYNANGEVVEVKEGAAGALPPGSRERGDTALPKLSKEATDRPKIFKEPVEERRKMVLMGYRTSAAAKREGLNEYIRRNFYLPWREKGWTRLPEEEFREWLGFRPGLVSRLRSRQNGIIR